MNRERQIVCSPHCLASSCFGSGINGYRIESVRLLMVGSHSRFLKSSDYGKCVPTHEECREVMLRSGHSMMFRQLREETLFYTGSLRRSMRKHIKRGEVTNIDQYFSSIIKHFSFNRSEKDFRNSIARNKKPASIRFSNPRRYEYEILKKGNVEL